MPAGPTEAFRPLTGRYPIFEQFSQEKMTYRKDLKLGNLGKSGTEIRSSFGTPYSLTKTRMRMPKAFVISFSEETRLTRTVAFTAAPMP
jgi:hypothetical protein